jgi:NAD(P)-dependent dehydrogenase (short-subunit alcohol dehydrogenase family)
MRKQSSGTIVNVSSIGGKVGLLPYFTAYHASKFALEGYTESLRQELVEFGINVILIEPGAVGTNFMDNMKTGKNYNPNESPYAKTIQRVFEGAQVIMANTIHPREVAQVILNAVNSASPNVRYSVGKDAESILKRRAELSDTEMEQWVRESYMEKKGFIRE